MEVGPAEFQSATSSLSGGHSMGRKAQEMPGISGILPFNLHFVSIRIQMHFLRVIAEWLREKTEVCRVFAAVDYAKKVPPLIVGSINMWTAAGLYLLFLASLLFMSVLADRDVCFPLN